MNLDRMVPLGDGAIQEARRRLAMSREALARRAGVPVGSVARAEAAVSQRDLRAICAVLGVDPLDLPGIEIEMTLAEQDARFEPDPLEGVVIPPGTLDAAARRQEDESERASVRFLAFLRWNAGRILLLSVILVGAVPVLAAAFHGVSLLAAWTGGAVDHLLAPASAPVAHWIN